MHQYLLFVLLGVGAGAVYASLAMGLVIQYKSIGVINFAYGAMTMLAAFQFDELRKTGDLVMPWAVLPARLHVAERPGLGISLAAVLALTALTSLAVYALVFRPLRTAGPLAKVAASVGLMIVFQAIVIIQFGTESRRPVPILPNQPIRVLGVSIARDRMVLVALTVGVAAGLWVLYRFTRFGLATRAAAESERGALLVRVSPGRLAAINSVLVALMAATFGILVSPITGLDTTNYTLFIVPALAAALLGRLTLISVTAVAGLGIGMLQALLQFVSTKSWFPTWARSGAIDAIPFVLIVIALFVAGDRLPTRGSSDEDVPLRSLRRHERWQSIVAWLVVATIGIVVLHDQYRFAATSTVIGVIVMLSFVVLTGYLGQISLAGAAVAGVSGFALSKLATDASVPFPVAPVLAATIAAAVGCLIGIPALRIRGVQLAVVTLAGAITIEHVVFNNPALVGGLAGAVVPAPEIFGIDLGPRGGDQRPTIVFGLLCVTVLGLLAFGVAALRRSQLARQMISVRSNERSSAAVGIDSVRVKLAGYACSSFIVGIGGAMLGYHQSSLSASSFSVFVGLQWLALAYLGGIASINGAFVAALMLPGGLANTLMTDVWHIGQYHLLLSGFAVVITAVANPEGIAASLAGQTDRLRGRTARPARPNTSPVPADQAVERVA